MKPKLLLPLLLVAGCSAYVIPSFYDALQRSKMKRSMADLRIWAEAIEEHMTRHDTAPRPGYAGPVAGIASLVAAKAPVVDGWGHPILYHASAKHYALRSTGRDGVNDRRTEGVTTSYDDDIVIADGVFERHARNVI